MNFAWNQFGQTTHGLPRVQAICDWVHNNIEYRYLEEPMSRIDFYVNGFNDFTRNLLYIWINATSLRRAIIITE